MPQIQEIADFLGDSLELSKISKAADCEMIVFCGVQFMAETAKILSPHKKVIMPVIDAGCPLADMITPDQLRELKAKHPEAWVVSYVNSSAEIKALSDVCCTSANAITVVKNVPVKKIIFVPDKNLGWWVAKHNPDKEIILWDGYCIVHEHFTLDELHHCRKVQPDAVIMVHPECRREILKESDFVLSTAGMMREVKSSSHKKFIIGTEEGLIYRLSRENPDKEFFSLGSPKTCVNMKRTSIEDLVLALEEEKYLIELDSEIIGKAQVALMRMVKYV